LTGANKSPAPQPIELDADPVRLAQVFSNLFNNACKYRAEGPCLAERRAGWNGRGSEN
jgi:signal transduction histidine kinase